MRGPAPPPARGPRAGGRTYPDGGARRFHPWQGCGACNHQEVPVEDFEKFVRARWASLARTAYLLAGDRHLAEDLVQEALSRAAERWPALVRDGRDPEPYVRRVLYSRAVDGWRWRRRRPESLSHAPPEPETAADDMDVAVRRLILRDALGRLTPRQRAVLVLRFYEDRTEVETAELLACSANTIKSQTRHALARLRVLAPELAKTFGQPATVEGVES
jgi:RNA polymerase sigma-70 factor (sigma-E family)